MSKFYFLFASLSIILCYSCQSDKASSLSNDSTTAVDTTVPEILADTIHTHSDSIVSADTLPPPIAIAEKKVVRTAATYTLSEYERKHLDSLPDTAWVDMAQLDSTILLDIRYATTNNFMELQIYDCPACFTRAKTAKALLKIHRSLQQQGLGLKMFDCYRPSSAQYKLWKKMPDRRYVAPPEKGSVHSRGGAVDLTLVVLETGQELEMGTPYDYFGREAYWSYTKHPESINNNRQLLRSTMEKYGFKITTTEWWHYSYRRAWYPLSNMQWPCQ